MSEIDLTDHNERGSDDPTGEVLPLDSEPEGEQEQIASKPVGLPAARTRDEQRVARELRGHTASPAWLPADWPELAERRAEHRRLVDAIARGMGELAGLERSWRAEDRLYQERLRLAVRGGEAVPADERTDPQERDRRRGILVDQLWAAAGVLAELVAAILTELRENEAAILERLRGELSSAEGRVRELQRVLAEARTAEWSAHQGARWLMDTCDDQAAGRQPFPPPSQPPKVFSAPELERPWSRLPEPTTAA